MKLGKWKLFEKRTIFGCEASGDAESAYLTRWTILGAPSGVGLHLHRFHRSDADTLHDHPWPFASLILWRGYVEEAEIGAIDSCIVRERIRPGRLILRPASWIHRVELVDGKPAWTLVLTGRYERQWGFWTAQGWKPWQIYFADKGCKP